MYTNTYSIYTKVVLYTFHKDRLSRCYFALDFPEVLDCACDGGVIIFFCWGEGQDRLCFPVSMTNVLVAHHGFFQCGSSWEWAGGTDRCAGQSIWRLHVDPPAQNTQPAALVLMLPLSIYFEWFPIRSFSYLIPYLGAVITSWYLRSTLTNHLNWHTVIHKGVLVFEWCL